MKEIGTLGEKLIARWLQLQNYDLLQRNWHCRWGEIDLISQDKLTKAIAFVEVKTRSKNNWDENGLLAVNRSKQQKLLKTASLFLAKHPQLAELPCRFDVALVGYQTLKEGFNNSTFNFEQITQLKIGQPVTLANYQLTIENYIKSAFD
ncbi:YraN family protein [Pleurocapsa sp. PCC 7319]|uniref:YraN family protein n=1 Tax=Pleurocapsa sp. PCC 7319 TaxID=118161 RepID=UPI00034BBBF4|nr:YraN family protein [Pleurocapsa sp. PCC 7319]